MKFNFKKIASVIAGTVMMSSTLAFAAAANYPAPFVKDGNANVAIIYGSQPGAEFDLVGVADITTNLQAALAAQTATSGTTTSGTSVSGSDYVTLAKPSDKVNLGNVVSTVFGSTITSTDLPQLLDDDSYTNGENSNYAYEQRITLGTGLILNYFSNSDYSDRKPSIGINLTSNQVILNYSLDFTNDAESDVSSGDLVDLENTNINILGKKYYISDWDNSTLDMTLLDTANSAIATEGETTTVKVGDKSYDASISFVDSSNARLNVNGEVTNSLSKGGTYKLKDGTYVGIKDILYNAKDTGISKVEFSLGSGKLELRNANTIRLNDNSIQSVTTEVKRGTASGGKEKIDRVNIVWTVDQNTFITPDKELSLPGLQNIKFSMSKPVMTTPEVTTVSDGATDYMQLQTTLDEGAVTIPFLFANASGEFNGTATSAGPRAPTGKGVSDRLVTSNTTLLAFNYTDGDRYFVASWNSSTDSESYYLRFTSFKNDNGVNKTTVESLKGGSWTERCADRRPGDTCTLGSLTLTISKISEYSDRFVNVTGNAGTSFNTLYTKNGLKIWLPWETSNNSAALGAINGTSTGTNQTAGHSWNTFDLTFTDKDRNGNLAAGNQFNVTVDDNTNNEVEASTITTGRSIITDPVDSNHQTSYVYDDLGTLVERTGVSSDQRQARVTANAGELYADVILTAKTAEVSSGSSSTTGGRVKELGSVLVRDSEVASVAGRNLIVVGGSCVNRLAAELLSGAGCGSDFEQKTGVGAGSFLIQTFDRGTGKVATLVAGYHAQDTANAAKILTTGSVDTTAGKKYKSTSATTVALVGSSTNASA